VTGFKAQDVTGHWYSRERELAANGRSSNNHGTRVKFMSFCRVLFTFNKYSEFLASLVICIHETVGLCRVWITVYCGVVLNRGLPSFCAHTAQWRTSRTGRNKILNWHVGWHSRKQHISWRPDCKNAILTFWHPSFTFKF